MSDHEDQNEENAAEPAQALGPGDVARINLQRQRFTGPIFNHRVAEPDGILGLTKMQNRFAAYVRNKMNSFYNRGGDVSIFIHCTELLNQHLIIVPEVAIPAELLTKVRQKFIFPV